MNCLMDVVFFSYSLLSEICCAHKLIQSHESYFVDNRLYCAITEQVTGKNL